MNKQRRSVHLDLSKKDLNNIYKKMINFRQSRGQTIALDLPINHENNYFTRTQRKYCKPCVCNNPSKNKGIVLAPTPMKWLSLKRKSKPITLLLKNKYNITRAPMTSKNRDAKVRQMVANMKHHRLSPISPMLSVLKSMSPKKATPKSNKLNNETCTKFFTKKHVRIRGTKGKNNRNIFYTKKNNGTRQYKPKAYYKRQGNSLVKLTNKDTIPNALRYKKY